MGELSAVSARSPPAGLVGVEAVGCGGEPFWRNGRMQQVLRGGMAEVGSAGATAMVAQMQVVAEPGGGRRVQRQLVNWHLARRIVSGPGLDPTSLQSSRIASPTRIQSRPVDPPGPGRSRLAAGSTAHRRQAAEQRAGAVASPRVEAMLLWKRRGFAVRPVLDTMRAARADRSWGVRRV